MSELTQLPEEGSLSEDDALLEDGSLTKDDSLPEDGSLIDFDPAWLATIKKVKDRYGKKPDMEALLFIIGIQELGRLKEKFTKEEKQNLMHIAVCKLLSNEGYYDFNGEDEDGWPHYEPTTNLPVLSVKEQEVLLKRNIIRYFGDL